MSSDQNQQKVQQEELLKKIKALVKEYNDIQQKIDPNEEYRLIADQHSRVCCCSTCWYEFGGKDDSYRHKKFVNSVYANISNSDSRFCKD